MLKDRILEDIKNRLEEKEQFLTTEQEYTIKYYLEFHLNSLLD